MVVGSESVDMFNFSAGETPDKSAYSVTVNGIQLTRSKVDGAESIGFSEDLMDQVHEGHVTVPSSYFSEDGILSLGLKLSIPADSTSAQGAGIDNLNVTRTESVAMHRCRLGSQLR